MASHDDPSATTECGSRDHIVTDAYDVEVTNRPESCFDQISQLPLVTAWRREVDQIDRQLVELRHVATP